MLNIEHPLAPYILSIIRPWRKEGRVSIPAAINAEWTTICSYQILTTEHAFLTKFGYEVNDPTYDWNGSLLFRLLQSTAPVRDFDNMQLQAGSLTEPCDLVLNLVAGQIITFQARRAVASALPQYVSAAFNGCAWPQKYCIPFFPEVAAGNVPKPR